MNHAIAKITRPRLSGIFSRKRLFKLLDQGRKKPVIWVSAPAGSGKTTLVASYLDSRKLPCLWYQVDSGDGDMASFFYYMGLAAAKAAPRYQKALPLLTPEYLQGIPVFTRRYFEELFNRLNRSNRFCIVFDNYQDAPQESGFHGMIGHALEAVPDGIRVVILSRTDPPAELARFQANNRLQLIGWDNVRFTREESGELLKKQGFGRADKKTIALLHEKTEGWAAGLVLLIAGTSELHAAAAGNLLPGGLFDYFASEIFSKTDEPVQDVLLKTSFLQRIDSADAEELTGNRQAGSILERLSRQHYFTQKYGRAYQYHPLFREFLRDRAGQKYSSEMMSQVQRAAARLLEKTGRGEEAAELLLAAEDREGAERLALKLASQLVSQGRSRTLEGWLRRIHAEEINPSSWSLYWLGICRLAYNPAEAREYLESAFHRFKKEEDVPGLFLSWAWIADTFFYEWSSLTPLDPWIEVAGNIIAEHHAFPSPDIEARFTAGMLNALAWRQPSHPGLPLWVEKAWRIILHHPDKQLRTILCNHLVYYHIWIREFAKAGLAMDVLRRVSDTGENNQLMQQHCYIMEAIYSWVMADGASCTNAVKNGSRNAEESGIHLLDTAILAQGVFSGVTLGDPAVAEECLEKMSKINSPRIIDKALYNYQAASVAWYHGDFTKAIERGQLAVRLIEGTGAHLPHATCLIELAVSLFDGGRREEAEKVLARGGEIAQGMNALEFLYLIHGARFAFDLGEEKRGMTLLKQALASGSREGYVNIFRWHDGNMSRLCAIALEQGIEVDYVRSLIKVRKLFPPSPEHADAWPWPVKITTLGRFEVRKDGKPVPFAGKKKQLELLKVLVSLSPNPVREEQVTDILWPDAEGDDAHNSFKTALSRLRGMIGNEAVLFDEGVYSLNSRVVRADAWDFERMCEAALGIWGRNGESKDKTNEAARMTGKALDLYQGHFLPDDASSAWTVSQRERLKSRLLRLTLSAGRYYEEKGMWMTAAGYYEKGLDADRLREEFYQRLMLCHHKLGRRTEALAVYDRCRTELSALDIAPSRETGRIYEAIK